MKNIKKYVKENTFLQKHFTNQMPTINKIDDNQLNNIYKLSIKNSDFKSLIIKHLPSYKTINKQKIVMPKNRADFEYFGLKRFKENSFRFVPEVYFFDKEKELVIMEYVQESFSFRSLIKNKLEFKENIITLADFIATNLSLNSLPLQNQDFDFENIEIKNYIYETLFFIHPDLLQKNEFLKNNFEELKNNFLEKNEALIHSNIKENSILCKNSTIFVLDYETCLKAPYSFELSKILSELFIDYIYYLKEDYAYAIKIAGNISIFIDKFEKYFQSELAKNSKNCDIKNTIQEAYGYCALHILQHSNALRKKSDIPQFFVDVIFVFSLDILVNLKQINSFEDILNLVPKV